MFWIYSMDHAGKKYTRSENTQRKKVQMLYMYSEKFTTIFSKNGWTQRKTRAKFLYHLDLSKRDRQRKCTGETGMVRIAENCHANHSEISIRCIYCAWLLTNFLKQDITCAKICRKGGKHAQISCMLKKSRKLHTCTVHIPYEGHS